MTNPNPAQLQHYISGVEFPASQGDLIRQASEQGADEQVVSTLQKLPTRRFDGPADVSAALSEISDEPGGPVHRSRNQPE